MTYGHIYFITHVPTGMVYFGQAQNLKKRWRAHRNALDSSTHHNLHLQNAWNKYTSEQFVFGILKECPFSELDLFEEWAFSLVPSKYLYNIGAPGKYTRRGVPVSEKTRAKLSKATSGENNPRFGAVLSLDTKAKMREKALGRPSAFKGKTHSQDAKAHLSRLNRDKDHKGYYLFRGKFKTAIRIAGVQVYLGTFDTEEEARQKYLDAKEELVQ